MARITVEDCLDHINNRFRLVRLAARRAKQILAGENLVSDSRGNKAVVSALREIADGRVRFAEAAEMESSDVDSNSNGHSELPTALTASTSGPSEPTLS